MTIYLGRRLLAASVRPTRMSIAKRAVSRLDLAIKPCTLFGLAPDGVCQAEQVTLLAGALLPHRFTLTTRRKLAEASRSRSAVYSLLHFP
jgi:hypothetical protein